MKRRRLLTFAAILATVLAVGFVAHRPATATVQVTASDPKITFDVNEFERKIATFCKTNAITTQVQYDAGVAGMAAGSALELQAVKAILGSVIVSPP